MKSTAMPKQGMNVPRAKGGGPKFTAAAKGANLADGVSHKSSGGDIDGMYARDEGRQRMPKGNDRA